MSIKVLFRSLVAPSAFVLIQRTFFSPDPSTAHASFIGPGGVYVEGPTGSLEIENLLGVFVSHAENLIVVMSKEQ